MIRPVEPDTRFTWDGKPGRVLYQIEIALPWNGKAPRRKLIDNYRVEIEGSPIEYLRAKQIRSGMK